MELDFSGCNEAELFTRELHASLAGVLAKNCSWDNFPGFVSASVDGRFWWDTMWTRDAGVFLREMAHWGWLKQGLATLRCLFRQVKPNPAGYKMFPEYFKPGEAACGSELDGTAAILIGGVLLWERLPAGSVARDEIWQSLTSGGSPLHGLLHALGDGSLVSGSGEFGGGCGIQGEFFNVVQNNLVRLALLAVGRAADREGHLEIAAGCRQGAERILAGMLAQLCYPDGSWMWCRRAPHGRIDWEILTHEINAGFGGLNGVLAMSSDVLGVVPDPGEAWLQLSINTFLQLLSQPERLRQFSRYGLWTQFDRYQQGLQTGPSYGHGYALQAMLLMDWHNLYTPAVNWLARATFEPLPGQDLQRDNDFWFYERYYSPDAVGRIELAEGCGALNLVCVMEPLKIARLMLGVDDHDPSRLRLVPRLPVGWRKATASTVPVLTADGLVEADISITASASGEVESVRILPEGIFPGIQVRLGTAHKPRWVNGDAD